jgi:glutamate formiminotransferase
LIECVPNFSEGRDPGKVDAIIDAMSLGGVYLLDRHSDADHNRTVITLAGAAEPLAEAVLRGVGKAADLIDMTQHSGGHPRIGATDVVPFIPISGGSMAECVGLARRVGSEIWERYTIPVYFYEAAATRPERKNLENIRKGQFEGLREAVIRDPERVPDIGSARLHATAGATAVGARKFLIAFNIQLNTPDVAIARQIARAIRSSGGGLPHVKAIGVSLKTRSLAQVSINLTDFEQTPIDQVFSRVVSEAKRLDCHVVGSELVGLIPRDALARTSPAYLQIQNFSSAMILENRLAAAMEVAPRMGNR